MEHMYIDSGTTNIFDDVDKNDFKTDFGSEFPVGLTPYFKTHNYIFIHYSFCYMTSWNMLCLSTVHFFSYFHIPQLV